MFSGFLQTIASVLITTVVTVTTLFGGGVGVAIPEGVAGFETSLQASVSSSATTMTLVKGTDVSGDNLSGTIGFTIDEGSANEEHVICTASATALTSCLRGLDPVDLSEVTALQKTHRRGASVKITNFPLLQRLKRILNGDETIPNVITYDNASSSLIVGAGDLASKAYVDDVVTGGAISHDQLVEAGTAGETVAAGELVYFDDTDNEWKLVDADIATTTENVLMGIAQGSGTNGNAIAGGVLKGGLDTNQSGLTPGALYYSSNTAGSIGSSAGTTERVIGFAKSATELYFDPYFSRHLTASEKTEIANLSPAGTIVMYGGSSAPSGYLLADGSAVSRTTYADLFTAISTTYGVGDGSTTFNVPDLKSSFPIGLGQRVETFTFVDADVNTGTDLITIDGNDYLHTGQAVVLSTDGVLPTGLSAQTYYTIRVSSSTTELATSLANAVAGTQVDITAAAGGGTHTLTLTFTNRALADEGGEEDHLLTIPELAAHDHQTSNVLKNSPANAIQGGSAIGSSGNLTSDKTGGDTAHNILPPYVVVNYIIKT